jgi:hypothetical protein
MGLLGVLMRRFGLPIVPIVIGVILGPQAELQLRPALQLSGGDVGALVHSPSKPSASPFDRQCPTPLSTRASRPHCSASSLPVTPWRPCFSHCPWAGQSNGSANALF